MAAKFKPNTPEEEAAIQRGIAQDPDNPELSDEVFADAKPAAEVMPPEVLSQLVRRRGPAKKPAKVLVTVRLRPDAVAALKARGPGWQTRIGEAVDEYLALHKSADSSAMRPERGSSRGRRKAVTPAVGR